MVKALEGGDAALAAETFHSQTRFGSLDGLRFFCILAVLWHHAPIHLTLGGPGSLASRGFLGVDFFFVLSGFLITTLLLREEAGKGRFSLRGFYWRRILRIVPVYYLTVFVAMAYTVGIKGQTEYLPTLPWYLLFMANFVAERAPNLGPTWSLGVEEQYYMIWPLMLLILPRRAILPVLLVLIAVNVAGIMNAFAPLGIEAVSWGPLLFALPNATYAPILMGSALALLTNNRRTFRFLWPVFGHRAAPLVALAVLLAAIGLTPEDVRGLPNLLIHLSMTAMLLTLVIREDNLFRPIMTWRPVARVGEISYGVYLYHLFALSFIVAIMRHFGVQSGWLVLISYALLSVLIAEVSFRTFEAYFRRLRHKRARQVVAA